MGTMMAIKAGMWLQSHPVIGSPVIGSVVGGYSGTKAGHYIAEKCGVSDEDNHGGLIGGAIGGAVGGGLGGALTSSYVGGTIGVIGGAVAGGVIGHMMDKGKL